MYILLYISIPNIDECASRPCEIKHRIRRFETHLHSKCKNVTSGHVPQFMKMI